MIKGLRWSQPEVRGTIVAELRHQEAGWAKARRMVVIRHEVKEKKQPGGNALVAVPATCSWLWRPARAQSTRPSLCGVTTTSVLGANA